MRTEDLEKAFKTGADEFEKDGGYSLSDRLIQRMQEDNNGLDMAELERSCVALCAIVGLLLQEINSMVTQMQAMGIMVVDVPKGDPS